MTYKQLEASREMRLWLTQIIAPAALAVTVIMANPERREKITIKAKGAVGNIKTKFKKKES